MKLLFFILFYISIHVISSIEAWARPLSNLEIYNRCYSQITGFRPSVSDPVTTQVRSGALAPLVACMNLLSSAQLTANGETTIANVNDGKAKAVLKNMHLLHNSWFQNLDIRQVTDETSTEFSRNLWDTTTDAMYFTRQLFLPTPTFRNIVVGNENLTAIRTTMNPPGSFNTHFIGTTADNAQATTITPAHFGINPNFTYAPRGELLGIRTVPQSVLTTSRAYYDANGDRIANGTVPFNWVFNLGGGVLGNNVYILKTLLERYDYQANVMNMPRKWGRAVYHDLLCRDLPVVRPEDAVAYVVPASPLSFRQSQACVQCHVSIDRTSSVIRGIRYEYVNPFRLGDLAPESLRIMPGNTNEVGWPTSTDATYAVQKPSGVLYYRNYQGTLVNLSVNNISELGSAIANQDDLYICAAKRYYEHFTGVKADILELNGRTLSAADLSHRNQVIQMGLNLRSHNNLRTLIGEIMNLPIYRESNFGQ